MTNEKILIVDDEESVRWVLKKALEKEGFEAVLAKDAAEGPSGWTAARERGRRSAFIFL